MQVLAIIKSKDRLIKKRRGVTKTKNRRKRYS